jgi:hypothetical protein
MMNFYAIYRGGSLKAGKWEFHGRKVRDSCLLLQKKPLKVFSGSNV